MSECSAAERIQFEANAPGQPNIPFEMSRLTGWKYLVVLDAPKGKMNCDADRPEAACVRRAQAYAAAHVLMHGNKFENFEIVSDLYDKTTEHVSWRVGNLLGKIAVIDPSVQLELKDNYGAKRIADIVAAQCTNNGGAVESLTVNAETKTRYVGVVRCKTNNKEISTVVSAFENSKNTLVLSVVCDSQAEPEAIDVILAKLAPR